MPDIEKLSTVLFDAVQDYVRRSFDAFAKRQSDTLEAKLAGFRQPEDGKPGADGKDGLDGADADLVGMAATIERVVSEEVAKIPRPVDGKDGAAGAQGEPGAPGKDVDPVALERAIADEVAKIPSPSAGKDGIDGKDGINGKDGKDVDPAALDEIRASVADMLKQAEAALDSGLVELAAVIATAKGLPIAPASFFIDDKGELVAVYPDGTTKSIGTVRGKDGNRGASIMDGGVDAAGQLTFRMSDGRLINVGMVRGEPGKPGESGNGAPGRDAIEVRILPTIDESKNYPEGTCAAYRGGTIRADRTTDPVDGDILKAGWRVILEGIAEEAEQEIDGGRFIERTTIYTSGRSFTRKAVTRAMVYCGIWTDKEFLPGDTVTWDGSLWHCENQTRDKPGLSPNWKLVAKRGRDGKDATKH